MIPFGFLLAEPVGNSDKFLGIVAALVHDVFMVPPRHGEYLLPKLGSNCDLLPSLGSDLQQRTIQEVKILHIEQIGLGETSCARICCPSVAPNGVLQSLCPSSNRKIASPDWYGQRPLPAFTILLFMFFWVLSILKWFIQLFISSAKVLQKMIYARVCIFLYKKKRPIRVSWGPQSKALFALGRA